ncbi:MAG: nucleotidyltransferase domain-containing protein [Thermoguttaceae bacterium]
MMTIAYEQHLNRDLQWALREGSMHFEGKSAVYLALEKITQRLKELNVPYAVAGGMALFAHGLRRFTEDVDILVRREDIAEIHRRLEGLGYVPLFSGSKNLRDAESGVRIEFLVAGDYPGDGKPKPVVFPEPESTSVEKNGICWLTLPALIELKLASGMTNPARLKDLGDVQELIRTLSLPPEYRDQLHPFVREKFTALWNSVANDSADV